ncbi:hypothetical protein FRC03_006761 [Tulasnella sp. 419]|nr:hypothetical protein FRC03_006761 [Tulasnella sp. 419]
MASRLGEKLSLKDKRPETKPEENIGKGEESEEREEVDTVKPGVEGVEGRVDAEPQGGASSSAEQKVPKQSQVTL